MQSKWWLAKESIVVSEGRYKLFLLLLLTSLEDSNTEPAEYKNKKKRLPKLLRHYFSFSEDVSRFVVISSWLFTKFSLRECEMYNSSS